MDYQARLQAEIETLIPISVKDSDVVKEAKVFARKEAQEAITALFLSSVKYAVDHSSLSGDTEDILNEEWQTNQEGE